MSENKNVLVFVDDALTSTASLEGSGLSVVHSSVPVGQHVLGELGVEVDHANAEVRPEEVEVVGDGPHDDDVDVLVAELPGDRSRRSCDRIFIVDCDNDFSVGRKDFPLVISVLKVSVKRVGHRKAEHPFGPVLDGNDAPDLVAFVLGGHVPNGRAVEVGEAVLDEDVAVGEEAVDHARVVVRRDGVGNEEQEEAGLKKEKHFRSLFQQQS